MGTMLEEQPPVTPGQIAPVASVPQFQSTSTVQTSTMDVDDQSSLQTPTRDNFTSDGGHESNQPSPTDTAESSSLQNPKKGSRGRSDSVMRTNSLRSNHSVDSVDVDMDDDEEGSDNDSATSETGRPSKKKKGQRFFCTDFPPCQLSFTRSEHLARHIRKHTGERPFQCHCLRRFSRLDNLRQHAQTVHVNEEIPGDSLAATGTRFQRQIRTDRMRTPGSRARASTISGGVGSHSRGHSRNYSGSSIGSISDLGSPDDSRRRPQPLAMAQTPTRAGLTVDPYVANSPGQDPNYHYYHQSPSGYSTPTSVFSNDATSPMAMPPTLQSPISMTPRALTWGDRLPGRRLSVPSNGPSFQAAAPYNPGLGYMSPVASSNASTYSNGSSVLQSPTSSVFSDGRRESIASEAEIRRRTWHPGTYSYAARPATSGLSYYQTPDAPQPVVATQPAAAQNVRLPGIDSFDRATERPDAPPRRALSPMEVDSPSRRTSLTSPTTRISGVGSSDHSDQQRNRQHEFTHAALAGTNEAQRSAPVPLHHTPMSRQHVPQQINASSQAPPTQIYDAPVTPRQNKRHGWYNGPPLRASQDQATVTATRTSPEGSSSSDGLPTPSAASTVEYQPAIIHSNGDIEPSPLGIVVEANQKADSVPQHSHQFRSPLPAGRPSGDMDRLDALVAVATSENRAVEDR